MFFDGRTVLDFLFSSSIRVLYTPHARTHATRTHAREGLHPPHGRSHVKKAKQKKEASFLDGDIATNGTIIRTYLIVERCTLNDRTVYTQR